MVARHHLDGVGLAAVKQGEVLDQVQQGAGRTHAPQQNGQQGQQRRVVRLRRRVGVVFVEALPAVKVVPAAGDAAKARINAIGHNHQRVVVKQLGNRVFVVGVVVVKSSLQALVVALDLNEHQRQAVDKTHQVAAALERTVVHPQLTHHQKVVALGLSKVDHRHMHIVARFATGGLDRDAVAQALPVRFIVLQQGLGGVGIQQLVAGHGQLFAPFGCDRQVRVQAGQCGVQVAHQHRFVRTLAAQQRVGTESLGIEGVHRTPAQVFLQQPRRRFLDVVVFRIRIRVGGHVLVFLPGVRFRPRSRQTLIWAAGRLAPPSVEYFVSSS